MISDIGYLTRPQASDSKRARGAHLQISQAMKSFKSLDFAIEFHEQVLLIEVTGHLRDQLHRSAASIALNLSEGNAKASARDKRHFFQMAYGSLRECQTIFKLLKVEDGGVLAMADRLGATLYKLINSQIKDSPNWR